MHKLQLVTERAGETEIIHITGGLDHHNFTDLDAMLRAQLRTCRQNGAAPHVILECGEVSYIGSIELMALLDFAHLARSNGGDVKFARLAPTIEQVANLISNGDLFDCHPDVPTALEAFHAVAA